MPSSRGVLRLGESETNLIDAIALGLHRLRGPPDARTRRFF